MKTYLFTTLTEVCSLGYWVDGNIIPQYKITANNKEDALHKFLKLIDKEQEIKTTEDDLQSKQPMLRGKGIEVGYVMSASTIIEGENVNLSLWINIE